MHASSFTDIHSWPLDNDDEKDDDDEEDPVEDVEFALRSELGHSSEKLLDDNHEVQLNVIPASWLRWVEEAAKLHSGMATGACAASQDQLWAFCGVVETADGTLGLMQSRQGTRWLIEAFPVSDRQRTITLQLWES